MSVDDLPGIRWLVRFCGSLPRPQSLLLLRHFCRLQRLRFAAALSAIAVLATAAAFLGVILSVWFAKRRWKQRVRVAKYVGSQHHPIASDLLSAVEFAENEHPEFSPELLNALANSAAAEVNALEPASLVPLSRLKRPLLGAITAAAMLAAAFFFAPNAMARGWANMAGSTTAAPFEGATLTTGPVVGDVEIRLTFPSYTKRPDVVLPAAAGDFRAMPGTVANIRTLALHRASSAQIVFGDADASSERDPIELTISETEPRGGVHRHGRPGLSLPASRTGWQQTGRSYRPPN